MLLMSLKKNKKKKSLSFEDPEIRKIIERLVDQRKDRCAFVGTSADDIAQEIRIKAWQVLKDFDELKGQSLEAFLSVCINNKLRNLKRDNYVRFIPPCTRNKCPLFDKSKKDCLIGYDPCIPYNLYIKRMQEKMMVRSPISYESIEWGIGTQEKEAKEIAEPSTELEQVIGEKIKKHGIKIYRAYILMAQGNKNDVDPKTRKKVRTVVQDILDSMKS